MDMMLQIVEGDFNEKYLEVILKLEKACFPADWQYPDANEYYKEALKDTNNINIFLKDNEAIIGYVLSRPHNKGFAELSRYDSEFVKQEDVYYIETIQIIPEKRGLGGAKKLLLAICDRALERGVRKFSVHARKKNNFNEVVKKIFNEKITKSRQIKNWKLADGEPYEYIEWEYKE